MISPWLETGAVLLLAIGGALLGRWFSRLPKPYWTIGYFVPLILIFAYGAGMQSASLEITPPISWIMTGRNKFALIGFIITLVLTTPLSRLRDARLRRLVCVLMALAVCSFSIWPFLAPALNRGYLATIQTRMDSDGVCLQSTDYNCGPAAAVTALRRLGFHAEEGEIAILAHTSVAIGTPPDMLALALQKRYQPEGLRAEYRVFKDVQQLRQAGLTLAVIRYNFWMDHFVTVLEVTDSYVQVADPVLGLARFSLEAFQAKWRFTGVVLGRG